MKTIQITEEQAKQMFESGIESLKSIAETNYPELFKKKIEWSDFGKVIGFYIDDNSEINSYTLFDSCNDNKNTFPITEEAEACLALSQLCQWRDKRNDFWKPDYLNDNPKYQLGFYRNKITKYSVYATSKVLSFKTEGIRNKFLEDFEYLIIVAKYLL